MANSPISIDVKAANSKLATHLRKREEDEALLQIGKRKVKDVAKREAERQGRTKHAKWRLTPDFSYPTPMVDRPRTTTGATSFHFSYTSISKEGSPTLRGKPMAGVGGAGRNPAADHSKYVERDGAAERSLGAEHASYVERPDAVEMVETSNEIAEGIERTVAAVVNETPLENEAQMLGVEDVQSGIPSIFSNIADDQFEREEYWRAVHRSERDPKVHQLQLDPDANPRWWQAMETAPDMDEGFRAHCLLVREKHLQWLEAERREPGQKPFRADPFTASSEGCGRAIDGARRVPGWDDLDQPLQFKSGRGGRIQIRFVAELPHEVSAEDRALIVQNFCDHLGSFSKDEDGNPVGMMYTAVIHAPDAHNDRRNYHLHVIAHDRPAKWLPVEGMWDFEYREEFNHKGEIRTRYPLRQNKIGEVSQSKEKTGQEISGRNFIPAMRGEFARITNAVLEARGVERRLDPRRYDEIGIERTPTEHLGTRAAALEAVGVPTIVGRLNAIAIWDDAERAIAKRAKAVDKALRDEQTALRDLSEDVQRADPTNVELRRLRTLMAERERLAENIADDRAIIMTFDHLEAKAKSRAVRTRQTCLQFLSDIETGKADRTTRSLAKMIRQRWQDAQAHIEAIDRDLAPDRPRLAQAAADVLRREERIKEIDGLLAPIKATLATVAVTRRDRHGRTATEQAPDIVQAPPASGAEQAAEQGPTTPARAPSSVTPGAATPPAAAQPDAPASDPATPAPQAPATASEEPAQPTTDVPAMEPVSMEGLPIVAPTIDPEGAPIQTATPEQEAVTPDGLTPLRPRQVDAGPTTPDESTAVDIAPDAPTPAADRPNTTPEQAQASPENGTRDTTATTPDTPDPASQPDQSEPVDRRRRPQDPTLFPPEESVAPIKPGTSRAEYADWDQLINRIAAERILIVRSRDHRGRVRYDVPSLPPADAEIITGSRFSARTGPRLAAIHDMQRREIDRLVRWIQKTGRDPAALVIDGRTARIGKAPDSIKKLMRDWRIHPDVTQALRSENERRVEAARDAARDEARRRQDAAPTQGSNRPAADRNERLAELAQTYPDPADAATPQVRRLIELLRADAPAREIQEAADAVRSDPIAREDVQRHKVELARAYTTALNDDAVRTARDRDRRGGR